MSTILSEKLRYVGWRDPSLIGKIAFGLWTDGQPPKFLVKVDDVTHPWYIGWHEADREDWRYVNQYKI